jgi:GMP synthase (glutamine-hydrolysing)
MNAPWIVLQHVPFEGPGLIAGALERAGARVDVRHLHRGDPVPNPDELAGLVVMGGPMNALDDATYPHLAAERELLAECVRLDVPVFAVCLGAQLLAAALGARVFTGHTAEVGLGVVALTPDARFDPVFGPAGHVLPVLHWHEDTFELPVGATLLASNDAYPHQAYRVGSAYATQFHLEIDPVALAGLTPELPPEVRIDHRHLALVNRAGKALFDRFVAHATQRIARPLAGSSR